MTHVLFSSVQVIPFPLQNANFNSKYLLFSWDLACHAKSEKKDR